MDVNWVASEDLQRPAPQLGHTHAIVLSRHDEYWTATMRGVAAQLVHGGVNLIDFGGNNIYHAGRFLDAGLRWYQVRKYHNPLHSGDAAWTSSYRFVDPPQNHPQGHLLGENFNCVSAWSGFRVSDPSFWAWRSRHIKRGTSYPNIVGSESDGPQAGYAAGTVFASLSPVYCRLQHRTMTAATSYRVDRHSGAGIIDIGTMNWLCNLNPVQCPGYRATTAAGRAFVTAATETILAEAGRGPLGARHPATGGVRVAWRASYSSATG
jgi:hypothetical protein